MKNKLLALIAILVLGATAPSFAAFPVRHATTENAQVNTITDNKLPATNKAYDKVVNFTDRVAGALHIHNPVHPEQRRSDTLGLLSMIFGILSLVLITAGGGFYFGIPAIILGAIGLSHHERFSLVGLILGGVSFIISLIAVILVVVFLSAIF
ncbi:MAG: hypothetical protein JWQ38_2082 [Flavipsychrobacter sp.]|nr:hypothetical protein [Flavipsychrobacter sp.]